MRAETLLPIARKRLVTVSFKDPLTVAADRLSRDDTNVIVVCDEDNAMVGIVSKTDIVARIGQCRGHACTTMVASVMTQDVVSCSPDDAIRSVWTRMKEKGHLYVPIADREGHPLGTLHVRDVLQSLLLEVEHEEDLLRDYVMGIGYR